jgi:GGDEF domain-containing protein
LAERLRAAVATRPAHFGTQMIGLTTSIGVALTTDANFEVLVDTADAALYCAKRLGRNRVEWAGDESDAIPA